MTLHALPDVGADPRRLIVLDAVHNFRDMGGYPTDDGRTTRWRTLFRADGLYRLAGADLEVVRELGLPRRPLHPRPRPREAPAPRDSGGTAGAGEPPALPGL